MNNTLQNALNLALKNTSKKPEKNPVEQPKTNQQNLGATSSQLLTSKPLAEPLAGSNPLANSKPLAERLAGSNPLANSKPLAERLAGSNPLANSKPLAERLTPRSGAEALNHTAVNPLPKAAKANAEPPQLILPAGGGDSHAHLDSKKLIGQLPQILSRAKACGLSHVGQVWLHPNAYKQHAKQFKGYPEVFFTLGIHPSDAQEFSEEILETMGIIIQEDAKVKAVGEIGLDFYWKDCPIPVQEQAFRRQLDLAKQLDKPVVIHSRDAATSTLRILQAEGFANRPLLWHCFGGDAIKILPQIIANGWYVSIPGPITFPKNTELKVAVAEVPLDQLLVETDCPYLTPQQWRGQINEPSLVTFAAEAVALARNMDPAELWLATGANLRRFFGLEAASS